MLFHINFCLTFRDGEIRQFRYVKINRDNFFFTGVQFQGVHEYIHKTSQSDFAMFDYFCFWLFLVWQNAILVNVILTTVWLWLQSHQFFTLTSKELVKVICNLCQSDFEFMSTWFYYILWLIFTLNISLTNEVLGKVFFFISKFCEIFCRWKTFVKTFIFTLE